MMTRWEMRRELIERLMNEPLDEVADENAFHEAAERTLEGSLADKRIRPSVRELGWHIAIGMPILIPNTAVYRKQARTAGRYFGYEVTFRRNEGGLEVSKGRHLQRFA